MKNGKKQIYRNKSTKNADKITFLENELSIKDSEIQKLEKKLDLIYGSKLWRIVMAYYRVKDSVAALAESAKLAPQKARKAIIKLAFYNVLGTLAKQSEPVNKNLFISLPTVDWKTPLFQRPQHFALSLSKQHHFIYCTGNTQYDNVDGFKYLSENLLITNLWHPAVSKTRGAWLILLSTQPHVSIDDVVNFKKQHKIIYDYVDKIHLDISGNHALTKKLVQRHKYILDNNCADLVLCVSQKLFDEIRKEHPNQKVALVPNGVEYDKFQQERNWELCPVEMKAIVREKKPIVGYYGALANWIDFGLINETARKHPEWNFVFIGVDYNHALVKLDTKLKNIHYLGAIPYTNLPGYAIWFDTAIIPFTKGEIALSTSPLKIYEYMAMGKTVVVTEDLVECHNFKGVFVSKNNTKGFVSAITKALANANDSKLVTQLKKQALLNTWKNRTDIVLREIRRIGK